MRRREKKKNQEIPIEIDNFDYSIPQPSQLPSTEDLLKVITRKKNVINDKFNFITRHFTPDQTQLL